MHVHSTYATVLACLADSRLPPIDQSSAMFYNRQVVDEDYGGLALEEEGTRCARLFQDPSIRTMIMGNHGVLFIGETVAETFTRMYYFERAARTYILALQTQRPLRELSPEIAEKTARQQEGDAQAEADLPERHARRARRGRTGLRRLNPRPVFILEENSGGGRRPGAEPPIPERQRGERRTPKAFLRIGRTARTFLRTISRYSCSRAKLSARPDLAPQLVEAPAQHLLQRPGPPGILGLQRRAEPLREGRDLLVLQVFVDHEGRGDRLRQVFVRQDLECAPAGPFPRGTPRGAARPVAVLVPGRRK
jgi:hypothetical protein